MQAVYTISHTPAGWVILHDGEASPSYDTVESAFEAAVSAASLALHQGLGVNITVDAESTVPMGGEGYDLAPPSKERRVEPQT